MAPIKRHPNRHHKCHKNIDSQNTQTNSFTISFGFCYKIFRVQKANFQICLRHYPNRILSIIYNFFCRHLLLLLLLCILVMIQQLFRFEIWAFRKQLFWWPFLLLEDSVCARNINKNTLQTFLSRKCQLCFWYLKFGTLTSGTTLS